MSRIFLEEHSEELRAEITQSLFPVLCRGHQYREGTKRVKSRVFKTSFSYGNKTITLFSYMCFTPIKLYLVN